MTLCLNKGLNILKNETSIVEILQKFTNRTMEILMLENLNITNIKPSKYDSLINPNFIHSIFLDENRLKKIDGKAFKICPKLIHLSLSYNKIERFSNFFRQLQNFLIFFSLFYLPDFNVLKILKLCHNKLITISGVSSLDFLEVLDISHNEIKTFDNLKEALYCKNLRNFDFRNNPICGNSISRSSDTIAPQEQIKIEHFIQKDKNKTKTLYILNGKVIGHKVDFVLFKNLVEFSFKNSYSKIQKKKKILLDTLDSSNISDQLIKKKIYFINLKLKRLHDEQTKEIDRAMFFLQKDPIQKQKGNTEEICEKKVNFVKNSDIFENDRIAYNPYEKPPTSLKNMNCGQCKRKGGMCGRCRMKILKDGDDGYDVGREGGDEKKGVMMCSEEDRMIKEKKNEIARKEMEIHKREMEVKELMEKERKKLEEQLRKIEEESESEGESEGEGEDDDEKYVNETEMNEISKKIDDANGKEDNIGEIVSLLCRRSNLYRERGAMSECLKDLKRIIMINPNMYNAYNECIVVLMKMGKYNESLECTNRLLKVMSNNNKSKRERGKVLYDRGMLLKKLKKNILAVKDFEEAMKSNKDLCNKANEEIYKIKKDMGILHIKEEEKEEEKVNLQCVMCKRKRKLCGRCKIKEKKKKMGEERKKVKLVSLKEKAKRRMLERLKK